MSELLSIILTNTYTRQDLRHRLSLVREFMEFQYFSPHPNPNVIYLLNEFFLTRKKDEPRDEFNALVAWGYDFYNQVTQENLYPNLEKIEAQAETLPVVGLFLPFNPPIFEIPKLGQWFRVNVFPEILLDVKNDPGLLGGCALAWKGVYRDFSLRFYIERNKGLVKNVIEEYLQSNNSTNLLHQ